MSVKDDVTTTSVVPDRIRNIAQPPSQLFTRGCDVNELLLRPAVTVVGSRKVSAYGKAVTSRLAGELAREGIVIISGLAFGVDSIAHTAALEAGGLAIAVLPTSLEHIYPANHRGLADRIVAQGGALVSEYPNNAPVYKLNFVARNRIASGLGDALLVTEAAAKSGSLHTAAFALEQGRPVLAVPGNITSPTSEGTNNLIKAGAIPVTCVQDILQVLGIRPVKGQRQTPKGGNPDEQLILDLLAHGVSNAAQLQAGSQLAVSQFNQSLTMLEIRGHIRPLGNNQWGLQ